jgi:hypothetical protein
MHQAMAASLTKIAKPAKLSCTISTENKGLRT